MQPRSLGWEIPCAPQPPNKSFSASMSYLAEYMSITTVQLRMSILCLCVCELLGVHPEGPPRGDAFPTVHIKEDPGPSINLAREVTINLY